VSIDLEQMWMEAAAESERIKALNSHTPKHLCRWKNIKDWGKRVQLPDNPTDAQIARAAEIVENATMDVCEICGVRRP